MLDPFGEAPDHGAGCGCAATHPRAGRSDPGPLTLMTQTFEGFIAEALDQVPASSLPDLRLDGAVDALPARLAAGLDHCGFGPDWLRQWMANNVFFQARLFAQLVAAERVRLRLETVSDDGCDRFHVDNVRYRLISTYRGPGTEWLDPKAVRHLDRDGSVPSSAIRRMDRGAIAFMRGAKAASAERPGLLHRSPPIEGTGVVRLVLVIDEATAAG